MFIGLMIPVCVGAIAAWVFCLEVWHVGHLFRQWCQKRHTHTG